MLDHLLHPTSAGGDGLRIGMGKFDKGLVTWYRQHPIIIDHVNCHRKNLFSFCH